MRNIMQEMLDKQPACEFCGNKPTYDIDKQTLIDCCIERKKQKEAQEAERKQKEKEIEEKKKAYEAKQLKEDKERRFNNIITKRHLGADIKDFKEQIQSNIELKSLVVEINKNKVCDKGILLLGTPGTGKTRFSFALAKYMINECNYYVERKKMYDLKSIYFENHKEFEELIKTRLLIVDDLGIGVSKNVDWEQEILTRIIDYRYEEMLPTIFTTNYDIDKLKIYIGERNTDRMRESFIIYEMSGNSWR